MKAKYNVLLVLVVVAFFSLGFTELEDNRLSSEQQRESRRALDSSRAPNSLVGSVGEAWGRSLEGAGSQTHAPNKVRVQNVELTGRASGRPLYSGQVPIGGYAILEGDQIWLRALVGEPEGCLVLRAEARGPVSDPQALGIAVAEDLLRQGAGAILEKVYGSRVV